MDIQSPAHSPYIPSHAAKTDVGLPWLRELKDSRDQHRMNLALRLEKIKEFPEKFDDLNLILNDCYHGPEKLYSIGRFNKCRFKSRYVEILTFDWSLIDHRTLLDDQRFFLHANRISVNGRNYISSQGPNPPMLTSFLQTLIIEDVEAVISLVMPLEDGKVKCENYWEPGIPYSVEILDKVYEIVFSDQDVLFRSDDGEQSINKSTMSISCNGEIVGQKQHFHYSRWPDHGTPDPKLFREFVLLTQDYGRDPEHPLLCHCSAGVGRTGTFQAVHSLAQQAPEENDLLKTITMMRLQRPLLVTNSSQYQFAASVIDYIRSQTGRI